MRRKDLCLAVAVVCLAGICSINLRAQTPPEASARQKEIAVTIDDVPLSGPHFGIERLRAMTDKILNGLK